MNKIKKNIIYFLICGICAILIQLVAIPQNNSLYTKLDFKEINSEMKVYNYDVIGDTFISKNNDPQLEFNDVNSNVSLVRIKLKEPVQRKTVVQLYYSDNNELSNDNCQIGFLREGDQEIFIKIPFDKYKKLRVDIGDAENVTFKLEYVKICDQKISAFMKISERLPDIFVTTIIVSIILFVIKKYREKFIDEDYKLIKYSFVLYCFIFFAIWAIVQPFNSCPDEQMRYDVILYVFQHNTLPYGGEESLINNAWGFSYAFVPYLSGLVSVLFMKIVSLFTLDNHILLISARMASVCFGTVTVYYTIKIADKLFNGVYKWLFICLISCLPQIVFISSYLNNDILALMSTVMMVYYWIEGSEKKWNKKSSIGLAISVAICALAYYNAYPFILFSVIFFIWSNINNKEEKSVIIKKFLMITAIVIILTGWWFIRNAILYNGDFLALKTIKEYSNMYAWEDVKPINRMTPLKQGISVIDMLFEKKWLDITYKSFLGMFGVMSISMKTSMYIFFDIIISFGIIGFILKAINKKRKSKVNKVIILFTILSSAMTVCLSIYNSYTADFQPQGRYIIECAIPLMICITYGIEYLAVNIQNKLNIIMKKYICAIIFILILISILCLTKIIIPYYCVL